MSTRGVVLGVMVALAATIASCARDKPAHEDRTVAPTSAPTTPSPEPPLTPSTADSKAQQTALPEQLRALHEAADHADSSEERRHAADELLEMFRRTETETSPHLISVRQDLAARAASLLIESSPERAKAAAESGLRISDSPSVLRANLFIALADAEEALGRETEARKALLRALTINEELFESELKSP